MLKLIRQAIADDGGAWDGVKAALPAHFELGGESLKTAPRGFAVDHPRIEDLRRKDFMAMTEMGEEAALQPDFRQRFIEHCRDVSPLAAYLCRVLELPY